MSAPDGASAALAGVSSIPRDAAGPLFPAPWAARAFALAVVLNERGVFAWSEWAGTLAPRVAAETLGAPADPEAYWRAWLATLEDILVRKKVAQPADLTELGEAWRRAAEATPHGEAIELPVSSQA